MISPVVVVDMGMTMKDLSTLNPNIGKVEIIPVTVMTTGTVKIMTTMIIIVVVVVVVVIDDC